jgi:hypothetical protein
MSHQNIIINSMRTALEDEEVREHMTTAQTTKVDQILAGPQPCSDDDFRYLQRRLARIYCNED